MAPEPPQAFCQLSSNCRVRERERIKKEPDKSLVKSMLAIIRAAVDVPHCVLTSAHFHQHEQLYEAPDGISASEIVADAHLFEGRNE